MDGLKGFKLAALPGVMGLLIAGVLAGGGADAAGADPACAEIRISLSEDGPREMPPARFDHEAHVAATEKGGGDCVTCHARLAPDTASGAAASSAEEEPFRIIPDGVEGAKALREAWHATCLNCHAKQKAAPGPEACHTCHDAGAAKPVQLKVDFDRSLHAVHIGSLRIPPVQPQGAAEPGVKENCGACHLTPDPATGNPVYVRNTEDAFSFYHVMSTDAEVLADAAHARCVACHLRTMRTDAGAELKLPVACADCHSPAGQARFPHKDDAPRLMRGQPDSVLLKQVAAEAARPAGAVAQAEGKAELRPVPYDHKRHEEVAACSQCHGMKIEEGVGPGVVGALGKAPAGSSPLLYAATHDPASNLSCVGCHVRTIKENVNCAGCHEALTFAAGENCAVCHRGGDEAAPAGSERRAPLPMPEDKAASIALADVPEFVTIGKLSKEYQAVKLPHRKIYQKLLSGMDGDALAGAFHGKPVCAACHHNVPDANLANPPSCVSCHVAEVRAVAAGQAPGLKHAYHQMCTGCHTSMNVKPVAVDCAGCHAPLEGGVGAGTRQEVQQ